MSDQITKSKFLNYVDKYTWNLGTKIDYEIKRSRGMKGMEKYQKLNDIKDMQQTLEGLKKIRWIIKKWKE